MTRSSRGDRTRAPLDDVSKAIIEQLQQDGRRSYAAIGKVVGLSEAAVRQRVQRLIDEEEDRVRVYRLCRACSAEVTIFGSGTVTEDPDVYIV